MCLKPSILFPVVWHYLNTSHHHRPGRCLLHESVVFRRQWSHGSSFRSPRPGNCSRAKVTNPWLKSLEDGAQRKESQHAWLLKRLDYSSVQMNRKSLDVQTRPEALETSGHWGSPMASDLVENFHFLQTPKRYRWPEDHTKTTMVKAQGGSQTCGSVV